MKDLLRSPACQEQHTRTSGAGMAAESGEQSSARDKPKKLDVAAVSLSLTSKHRQRHVVSSQRHWLIASVKTNLLDWRHPRCSLQCKIHRCAVQPPCH